MPIKKNMTGYIYIGDIYVIMANGMRIAVLDTSLPPHTVYLPLPHDLCIPVRW